MIVVISNNKYYEIMSRTHKEVESFDDFIRILEQEHNVWYKIQIFTRLISSIKNTKLFIKNFSQFEKVFIKIAYLIDYREEDLQEYNRIGEASAIFLDSIEGTNLLKNNFLFLIEKAKSLFERDRTTFFTHLLKIMKLTNLYQQYRQIIDEMLLYELNYGHLPKEMLNQLDGTEIQKNNFIAIIKAFKYRRGSDNGTLLQKLINSLELIDFKKQYLVAFLDVIDHMKFINERIYCFSDLMKKIHGSKFMLDNFSIIKKGIKNIYNRPNLKNCSTTSTEKLREIKDLIIPYEFSQRKEIEANTFTILYWGIRGSGKSTIVDTLYKITKEEKKEISPEENNIKVDINDGLGFFFDRGVFQSQTHKYQIYTIDTGYGSLFSRSLKTFGGFSNIDGIIFVVESQVGLFENSVESLMYLKAEASGRRPFQGGIYRYSKRTLNR